MEKFANQYKVYITVDEVKAKDLFTELPGRSIPNQEDHGFYPWVNWSSGTGCSPLVGVSWEPRALPVGLHPTWGSDERAKEIFQEVADQWDGWF